MYELLNVLNLSDFKRLTILPKEYRHNVTCGIFLLSNKSAVWKISSSGTPYFLMAAWNLKQIVICY